MHFSNITKSKLYYTNISVYVYISICILQNNYILMEIIKLIVKLYFFD